MDKEKEFDFASVAETDESSEVEMTAGNFELGKWVKNPEVNGSVELVVERIVQSKETEGKNKETGAKFAIGLKQKDGKVKRYDIYTDQGIYTIKSWEIFFKLLGPQGILLNYAKKHNNSFKGAKISIKKLHNGAHMSTNLKDLMAILGVDKDKATDYQNEIKKAIKEQRLFEIKALN